MIMTSSPTHQAAHTYAARGWRVIPVRPGEKRPAVDRWTDAATIDPQLIDDWWGRWPNFGVGIVTGQTHDGRGLYLFVLDVDITDTKRGDDTIADLEHTHQPLPDTVEAQTGGGGRHLLFHAPHEIRNDQAARLGPGLDIRGAGGFIVAPPTIHPSGNPYMWEHEHHPDDLAVADAPQWLLELLTADQTTDGPIATRVPYNGPARPGDRFAATITWPELLERDGAHFLGPRTDRRTGTRYELWSRPGLSGRDQHTSATLYYGGTDLLKVHSTSWPGLTTGQTYSRFGYFVATRYNGDFARATRDLARQQTDDALRTLVANLVPSTTTQPTSSGDQAESNTTAPEETTWERVDLTPQINRTEVIEEPRWLTRDDGKALIYPRLINALVGESGHGKSWIAITACIEALNAGDTVIYIDLEDHPRSIVARLRTLGATDEHLHDTFIYVRPERPAGIDALDIVDTLIAEHQAVIVVIDSVGEAMALQGMKQNDDDEVAHWYRTFARRWADLGPALILIDHVPKNPDGPKLFAIGSQRKKAAVDGAMYRADQIKSLGKGEHGILTLTVGKDRQGTYPNAQVAATFHYKSNEDGSVMSYQIEVPEERNEQGEIVRPTVLMERISKALEHSQAMTGRQIDQHVKGKAAAQRRARTILIDEGYVGTHVGPRGAIFHHSIRPYRNTDVPADFGPETSASPDSQTTASPPRPHRVPDAVDIETAARPESGAGPRRGPPPGTRSPSSTPNDPLADLF